MRLLQGDCREVMRTLEDKSCDAVVCDPPYELGFMGKKWDSTGVAYDVTVWQECLRVLKPGGRLLAFGGTRTYHRMACAIEDAGFTITDQLQWLYSTGFPKGHDVPWQLHEQACRACGIMEAINEEAKPDTEHNLRFVRATYLQTPVYACAECGQVLQPFLQKQGLQEFRAAWQKSKVIWPEQSSVEGRGNEAEVAREPRRCPLCALPGSIYADGAGRWLCDGASVNNGTIPWQVPNEDGSCPSYRPQSIEQLSKQSDAFRLERAAQASRGQNVALKPMHEPVCFAMKPLDGTYAANVLTWGCGALNIAGCRIGTEGRPLREPGQQSGFADVGVSAGSKAIGETTLGRWPGNVMLDDEAAAMLDEQSGESKSSQSMRGELHGNVYGGGKGPSGPDSLRGHNDSGGASRFFYRAKAARWERDFGLPEGEHCGHPTVKPVAVLRWLCRLVTPPGGTILDPFMGSGSCGIAAKLEGFDYTGIELDAEYVAIAEARIAAWQVGSEQDKKTRPSEGPDKQATLPLEGD